MVLTKETKDCDQTRNHFKEVVELDLGYHVKLNIGKQVHTLVAVGAPPTEKPLHIYQPCL